MSSGAYRIPDISSACSVNGRGGSRGGASGCVRAARSVAVRSFRFSVSNEKSIKEFKSTDRHQNTHQAAPLLDKLKRMAQQPQFGS